MRVSTGLLFLFMAIQCCGQSKERMKANGNGPIYRLKVTSSLSYTIRVNGITTASKNQNAGNTRWFLINNCIPASGSQELEITIRPAMTDDGMNHEVALGNIGDDHVFNVEIERMVGSEGAGGSAVIYQYQLPEGNYSRREAFVHKATFEADVPYRLEDWRKGKTFDTTDSVMLKAKVVEFYQKLKHYYEHRNGAEYVKLIEKGMYNLAQGAYFGDDALDRLKQSKIDFINKQPRILMDLDSYQLEISGNGKLVSLRRTDGYNRGEGVLRRKYTKNGRETVHVDDVWLYAPRGTDSTDDSEMFEIIVYQNLVKPYLP